MDASLTLSGFCSPGDESALRGQSEKLSGFIRRLVALGEELLPKVEDAKAENMGDLIDQEMEETQKAIESASKRFAVSLSEEPSLSGPSGFYPSLIESKAEFGLLLSISSPGTLCDFKPHQLHGFSTLCNW